MKEIISIEKAQTDFHPHKDSNPALFWQVVITQPEVDHYFGARQVFIPSEEVVRVDIVMSVRLRQYILTFSVYVVGMKQRRHPKFACVSSCEGYAAMPFWSQE